MSKLEMAVEELKSLPPSRLDEAAGYIHQLAVSSIEDRKAALGRAFGCITPEEADELERVINENCERIDASEW